MDSLLTFGLFWAAISIATGVLAVRKGYNFFLWALSAGLIGLFVLLFLPNCRKPETPPNKQALNRKAGNLIGAVLASFGLFTLAVKFLGTR